jgi:multidrug efflux system membrane fusion protein
LTLSTQNGAVVVPSDAIQVGPEGQQVFVVKEDKRVEVRPVTLGQSQEGESIITKGLASGEVVVREGQFLLGPNSRVEVKTAGVDASNSSEQGRQGQGERRKSKSDQRGAS